MVVIPYFPMRDEALKQIIRLKLGKIRAALAREPPDRAWPMDEAVIEARGERCTEVESGARNVDNILTNTMLPEVSRQILSRMAEEMLTEQVRVGVGEDGRFTYAWEGTSEVVNAAQDALPA